MDRAAPEDPAGDDLVPSAPMAVRVGRCVDLSVPLDEDTTVYPGDPALFTEQHATVDGDGFNLLRLHLGSQTGTHVDAPFHTIDGGARIDEVPLRAFAGEGVVVDATGAGSRERLGWSVFAPYADLLRPGVIVLLRTGWDAQDGTPAYFDHPYLEPHACRRLLDLGVRTFLADVISLDETPTPVHPEEDLPVHHLIAEAGGVIGENFRGFGQVDWPRPFVVSFPLRLTGADGAPVRAVAMELLPADL